MQRREDGTLRATVMDFGLAHDPQADDKLTRTGAVLGTPAYMSPEQARGDTRSIDRRSDVYSLGAMLYELLTSEPPFLGDSTVETLLKVVQEEPRPVRALAPTVPRDLETIAHKCLEKTPHRRYESAQALGRDLQAYLDGEPILAQPPSVAGRIWRRLRRHRLLLLVSLLSLLALAALSVGLVRARVQAAQKVRMAQLFGEQARELESIMRHGYTAPLHDIGRERGLARKLLHRLEEQMRAEGPVAEGPGHYALGRGYLEMQDYAQALAHLERARRVGYETPGLSYAQGRTLAELYRTEWTRSEFIGDEGAQRARRAELDRLYRQPAITHLAAYVRTGSDVGAGELDYVEALLAYCRRDYTRARELAQKALGKVPWLYEARRLEGDADMALGLLRVDVVDYEAALPHFAKARAAYEAAAQFARSDAQVRNGLARSLLHTLGSGSIGLRRVPTTELPELLAAAAQSLQADPQQTDAYRIELEGYQFLFQYRDARGELGPEIDEAIALADRLRRSMPELTPILLDYYLLKISYKNQCGLDPGEDIEKAEKISDEFFHGNKVNNNISPAVFRDALYSAGIITMRGAANSLSYGRSPVEYYKRIERWIDDLAQAHGAQDYQQLLRARYFTFQGEVLLKQGRSPMQPLGEALALLEQIEAREVPETAYYRGHVYGFLIDYQSLLKDNLDIDQKVINQYIDKVERDKFPWLWRQPAMLRFYLSLARLELHDGRDPGGALERLGSAIARCQQLGSCGIGEPYAAQGELVRARWLQRSARPDAAAIEASLAAAQSHVAAALRMGTPPGSTYRIAAERVRWQAEWALRQGRLSKGAIAVLIQDGLLLAARGRSLDPMDQETTAIEGVLHLLAARAAPGAAQGRQSAQAAADRLAEALEKNPLLRDEYEPLQREAARIIAGAPVRVAPPAARAPGLK